MEDLSRHVIAAWAPLGEQIAFHVERHRGSASWEVSHNALAPLEVGSCFKAIVAATCCRLVEQSRLDWDETLTVTDDVRVPASVVTEQLAAGSQLTVLAAAEAMMGVSDNTATDLLLRRISPDAVRTVITEMGLIETVIPDSVGAVYTESVTGAHVVACHATARDLTRFYRLAFQGAVFDTPAAADAFRHLLRQEAMGQGFPWPDGMTLYCKSGLLTTPPFLAVAIAGVVEAGSAITSFAFIANTEQGDDEEIPRLLTAFSDGVATAFAAIANG